MLKFENQMQHHYLLFFQSLFLFVPILQCWNIQYLLRQACHNWLLNPIYLLLTSLCFSLWSVPHLAEFPCGRKKKNELYITYHLIFVRKKVPCSLKTSRIWKLPGKASIMESLWLWFHDILYFTLLCLLCFILLYFYVLSWRWFKHSLSN